MKARDGPPLTGVSQVNPHIRGHRLVGDDRIGQVVQIASLQSRNPDSMIRMLLRLVGRKMMVALRERKRLQARFQKLSGHLWHEGGVVRTRTSPSGDRGALTPPEPLQVVRIGGGNHATRQSNRPGHQLGASADVVWAAPPASLLVAPASEVRPRGRAVANALENSRYVHPVVAQA